MTQAKRRRRTKLAGKVPTTGGPGPRRDEPPGREPRAADSVEDPLEDWPDEDDDRWLRERDGEDIEKPED